MLRYLILGLLRDGAPHHGYALVKEYRERSGLHIGTGNFYRELQRLAAAGLVHTVQKAPTGDSRRAPYVITAAGAETFDRWLAGGSRADVGQYDNETSVRALFITTAQPHVISESLERCRAELWLRSKDLEHARETLAWRTGNEPQRAVLQLLLARRLSHIAVDVQFLDDLRTLNERRTSQPAVDAPPRVQRTGGSATRAGKARATSVAGKGRLR